MGLTLPLQRSCGDDVNHLARGCASLALRRQRQIATVFRARDSKTCDSQVATLHQTTKCQEQKTQTRRNMDNQPLSHRPSRKTCQIKLCRIDGAHLPVGGEELQQGLLQLGDPAAHARRAYYSTCRVSGELFPEILRVPATVLRSPPDNCKG